MGRMSRIHNQLQQAPAPDSEWHVKIADGSVYGPVDLATLRSWSSQGRIEPSNEISQDRETWILAQDLRDLQMSWIAHLPDGSSYGPFNIHLLPELRQNEVLPPGTELEHRYSGERHPVDDPTMEAAPPRPETVPSDDDGELPLLALMGGQHAAPPPLPPSTDTIPSPTMEELPHEALPVVEAPVVEAPVVEASVAEAPVEEPPIEEAPAPVADESIPAETDEKFEVPAPVEEATRPLAPIIDPVAPAPETPPAPEEIPPVPPTEAPLTAATDFPEPVTTAPVEAILSGAVLSQRLEALQNSASLARSQLAASRKELSEHKAYASTLIDQVKKVEDELGAVSTSRTEAERGLVEANDRATMTESELENAQAQLAQLQDHYDRLQDESQKQFESLDSARAELMRQEQLHKEELTNYDDRITSKTALLARAVRTILQDDDLDIGNIPEGLLIDDGDRGEKELLMAELERLRAGGERDRRRITEQSDQLAGLASQTTPSLLRFIGGVVGIALVAGALVLLGLQLSTADATTPRPPLAHLQAPLPGEPIPSLEGTTDGTPPSPGQAVDTTSVPVDPDLMPESASRPSPPTAPPSEWPALTLPDAHILTDDNRLSVVYRYGLFQTDTTMVAEAEQALADFAKQMRPYTATFKIVAEGHTDATKITSTAGQYMDNYALGMARARAVRDLLVTKLGLPGEAVELTSLGEHSPLFSNDSDANRKLNRTVVLHVMPK